MPDIVQNDAVEMVSYFPEAIESCKWFARSIVRDVGSFVVAYARQNVAPGKGPGPHPHRIGSHHVDTGELQRNIHGSLSETGTAYTHTTFITLMYGVYLELGWVTSKKHIVRYPWLLPASIKAFNKDSKKIITILAKHYFPEGPDIAISSGVVGNIRRSSRLSSTHTLRKTYKPYIR